MKITAPGFWGKDNGDSYSVLSDFVHSHRVPMEETEPVHLMDIELDDCYVDASGDFYMPISYKWTYKGTNDTDDTNEYKPVYAKVPSLTSVEIEDLVREYNQ